MITIFKYILDLRTPIAYIPSGGDVLSAAFQDGELCIWAQVDTRNLKQKRYFYVVGTGHEILKDNLAFISTAFVSGMVFHVFEVTA
jgi:hypothetical protein